MTISESENPLGKMPEQEKDQKNPVIEDMDRQLQEMVKNVEGGAMEEKETDKSKYEKKLSEMREVNLEYDAAFEEFNFLKPAEGLKILSRIEALKTTPKEVYEACKKDIASVKRGDYRQPVNIINDYLGLLEIKIKNQETMASAKVLSEEEKGLNQKFFDEFIASNEDLTDEEKEKIKRKVLLEKGFWSSGVVDSIDINRDADPRKHRLVMKSKSGSQGYLYLNL